ncbi:alkaline phosphatase family protein [Halorussus salilacus]|uniref:alkaline phosphatase family protein n=1 Tax=Halorussus salilacus TaxID=2953750 RepID=UPI00209D35BA|nr:alkaline phosphatase family protein [Halorussus salilacus]USZ68088.1 alkaline phosphatase family protein [Halorussus salilacus]
MADRPQADVDTLLLGLDAGCRSVLDPLFEDGAVPNLRSLFENGADGPLRSQIPPWTPSAWPSVYTGVNPGKHGVFGFLTFDGYDWDVVNATHVRERTVWEILDYHGKSSVVVNAPVTHPPREVDGAVIPGYTAPEDPECHPEGLLSDVRAEIGDYRVYAPRDASGRDEKVEWYRRLVGMRGAAFRYLADRYDPDFGFVQFQQTDTVFHELPGDDEAVRAVYEAVDEQVGEVIDACDPDAVVVASDHGIGEYTGHEFRVNEFLREQGLVETTTEGEGMPTWSTIATNRLRKGESGKAEDEDRGPSVTARGLALGAKVGLTSQRIHAALDAVGAADFVAERVPADVARRAAEQVDFPESVAYMRDRIELGVRVNLAGREPDGIVSPDDYEQVRDDLVAMLSSVETPDGDPVFDRVARREEVFSGPHVERAPDVVTVPADFDEFLSTRVGDGRFGPPSEPYNHKREGVVALAGEGVDADADLAGAHLFDVAPTVLATLGLPAGDRMDGSVLPAVGAAGTEAYPAFDADERVATDDDDVEARLADLGYLE